MGIHAVSHRTIMNSLRLRAPRIISSASSMNCRNMAQKSKTKKKSKSSSESRELDQAQISMIKQALNLPINTVKVDPELIDAGRMAATDFNRQRMRKHHADSGRMHKGLKLQQNALAAMPDHLVEAALSDTISPERPFCLTRLLPTWTPPIKGYANRNKDL